MAPPDIEQVMLLSQQKGQATAPWGGLHKFPKGSRIARAIALTLLCLFCLRQVSFTYPERRNPILHPLFQVNKQSSPDELSKSRLGIVTINYGAGSRHKFRAEIGRVSDLYGQSLSLLRQYCYKWSYRLYVIKNQVMQQPLQAERRGLLSKEAVVLSVILQELSKSPEDRHLEWLYFVDADTIIMNHNIPLETFLPTSVELQDSILLVSVDQWNTMNSGGFFIRVSEESVRFLSCIIAESVTLDVQLWKGSDQALMAITSKKDEFIDKIIMVPPHWFNADAFAYFVPEAFGGHPKEVYRYGDFMVHFMGGGPYKRGWAKLASLASDQRNADIAPPLEETRYMGTSTYSISAFWDSWLQMTKAERRSEVRSCIDVAPRRKISN